MRATLGESDRPGDKQESLRHRLSTQAEVRKELARQAQPFKVCENLRQSADATESADAEPR